MQRNPLFKNRGSPTCLLTTNMHNFEKKTIFLCAIQIQPIVWHVPFAPGKKNELRLHAGTVGSTGLYQVPDKYHRIPLQDGSAHF